MNYKAYLLRVHKGGTHKGQCVQDSLHTCLALYEYLYGAPTEIRINPLTEWDEEITGVTFIEDKRLAKNVIFVGPIPLDGEVGNGSIPKIPTKETKKRA